MPKGQRGFQPGAAWDGRATGRPKKTPEERAIEAAMRHEGHKVWHTLKGMRLKMREEWQMVFLRYRSKTVWELKELLDKIDSLPYFDALVVRSQMHLLSKPYINEIANLYLLHCGPEPKELQVTGKDGAPLEPTNFNYSPQQVAVIFTAADQVVRANEAKAIPSEVLSVDVTQTPTKTS